MRAIRVHEFGPAEVLRLEQLPDPVPTEGQLLVRVPYTPGSDAAGVVVSIGAGVAATAVGQRVYVADALTGAYAELALCLHDSVFPLPASLSMAQGAAIASKKFWP